MLLLLLAQPHQSAAQSVSGSRTIGRIVTDMHHTRLPHPQSAAEGGADRVAVLRQPAGSPQRRCARHEAGLPGPCQPQRRFPLDPQLLQALHLQQATGHHVCQTGTVRAIAANGSKKKGFSTSRLGPDNTLQY